MSGTRLSVHPGPCRLCLLLATALLLSACQPEAAPAALPASAAHTTPVQRGIYVWGLEVETFTPCNSTQTYWLEGDEALLAPLQEMALQLADAHNDAYQPVYVEIHAQDAGMASDGLAVEYDGVLHLQQVIHSSSTMPAHCQRPSASPAAAPPASQPAEPASRPSQPASSA